MAMEMASLRSAGADGFVIGCLTPEGELDGAAMELLLNAAAGLGLTLHRCIDVSRDLTKTYRDAANLGFDTVLTSGGAGNCVAGIDTISQLLVLRDRENGPEVLIGAGVNAKVIAAMILGLAVGLSYNGALVITLGSVTISLSGLAVAALVGIFMNAVLPGKDYEFGANAQGDTSVNFGTRAQQ